MNHGENIDFDGDTMMRVPINLTLVYEASRIYHGNGIAFYRMDNSPPDNDRRDIWVSNPLHEIDLVQFKMRNNAFHATTVNFRVTSETYSYDSPTLAEFMDSPLTSAVTVPMNGEAILSYTLKHPVDFRFSHDTFQFIADTPLVLDIFTMLTVSKYDSNLIPAGCCGHGKQAFDVFNTFDSCSSLSDDSDVDDAA